jgi:hypothetical protein
MNFATESVTSALPTLLLWAGISLIAIMLLAKAANRRRESLTDALKKHVAGKVGLPKETPPGDSKPTP